VVGHFEADPPPAAFDPPTYRSALRNRAAAALPDRDTPEIERARPVVSHGIVHDHPLDATGV
jgi:hypothetical protein